MSTAINVKPRLAGLSKYRLAIVASQFNPKYTDALVEAAIDELAAVLPNVRVDLVRVPGAFEIPLATKLLLTNDQPDVIVCLGVILEGETAHADLVATSVTDQLLNLSIHFDTPVIHEVLLCETEQQAHDRCLGHDKNRGIDAAHAAAAMLDVCRELKKSTSRKS